MAKAYANPSYDVRRLAELRDPRELGRTLRERPERFSMLNAQSHLKGWLKVVDDPALQAQVLAVPVSWAAAPPMPSKSCATSMMRETNGSCCATLPSSTSRRRSPYV